MRKQRASNFELLRILSMCGIIIMHYVNSEIGGAVQESVFPNFSWLYVHLVSGFCVPLVNCFVLITGYFLVNQKTFCLRKATELLCITAFYGAISYFISVATQNNIWDTVDFAYAVIPFWKGARWFVETYIILILLAPFLNKMLCGLDKKSYEILLAIQILLFSIWYSVGLSAPVLDDGYGIINFITLYGIGGYLKRYGNELRLYKGKKWPLLATYLAAAIFTFFVSYFTNPYGYAFITNIIGAVALFAFFAKCDIGQIKWINQISEGTFDVYFVHSDKNTSLLLMYELLGAKFVADTPWIMLHVIFVIIVVWILGLCAFKIRKKIFDISINRLLDKICFINRKIEI